MTPFPVAGVRRIALPILLVLLGSEGVLAQDLTLSLGGDQATLAGRVVQIMVLVTILSLAPALAIMVTCFPFIVTVLSILRQGLGLQQSPPNMLIISLALFLTYFVMAPVFDVAWQDGIAPLLDGRIELEPGLTAALLPFREFMAARLDPDTYSSLAELRNAPDLVASPDSDLSILIPSFMISEIERAFQIGFIIFLPFLIIDLVVAAVLMSMGMMMVPPAIVALPFKLAFFVVADGWTLISTALVTSYL